MVGGLGYFAGHRNYFDQEKKEEKNTTDSKP